MLSLKNLNIILALILLWLFITVSSVNAADVTNSTDATNVLNVCPTDYSIAVNDTSGGVIYTDDTAIGDTGNVNDIIIFPILFVLLF